MLAAGSAQARTDVCYQGGTLLPNFQLNGSALLNGTDLLVTNNQANQKASVMYRPPFAVTSDIHIEIQFRISQPVNGGADGMAFVMHADPRGASAIGAIGGGLSYGGAVGERISPSVVVELDTFQNGFDANNNHIAITQNGDETIHLARFDPAFDMRTVESFHVWIDYNATASNLDVYISQNATKPVAAQMTQTINLATAFGNMPFYMGFTGATGGAQEVHEIVRFAASDSVLTSGVCCAQDTDCQASPLGPRCDAVKHVCGQCTLANISACGAGKQACDLGPGSNTCITPCDGDFGSGTPAACPSLGAAVCQKAGPAAGSCISCNGNFGSSATQACPAGAPSCSQATGWCGFPCARDSDCGGGTPVCDLPGGSCVQCTPAKASACTGATAICDATSKFCRACKSDADCGSAGETPVCDVASGICKQCSAQNFSVCRSPTPACNTTSYTCVECTADDTRRCTALKPLCDTSRNVCAGCTSDKDCSGDTPLCNTSTGHCGACLADNVSLCPAERKRCEQVNYSNVCVAEGYEAEGCICNVGHKRSPGDIALVAMALLLSAFYRRRITSR